MKAKGIKPFLYMLTAAFLFCFTEIALKILNGAFNCLELNFSRYFVAGLLLIPFALAELRKKDASLLRSHFFYFQLLGFIGITLVGPFYQLAAGLLQANVTSILFSLNPMFIAVLALFILKEPLSHHQMAGLVLEFGAVLILVNPLHMNMDPAGLVLLFLTLLCYSLYAVIGKKMIQELGSAVVTAGSFLCGGIQLFLLALLSHVPAAASFLTKAGLGDFASVSLFGGYSLDNIGWVLLLFLGITLGAYLCWFKAMECGSTFLGSLTYFVKPALSPFMAWFFLGEIITGRILAGVLLMLLGAGISLRQDDKESAAALRLDAGLWGQKK
ncbi:MAG: Putative membrane protein [Mitsuokella multacida]